MSGRPVTEPLDVRLRQARPIPLDAAFGVAAGELLALVGPSGAGKTTCLRMIAGLDRPADGRISGRGGAWFDAAAGIDRPPQARAIGMVFQHYALFPHLGALDNVALALGHRPAEARAARARELLDLVNLAGLEARKPAQLSGGQQQRVALARALARDPAALLLDEPFAAVDQVTRRKLQRELAQLRRRLAMPIVLVTHDLDEAAALADRMAILSQGRTLQIGPPAEILARPKDAQVARLVGLTNLFSARVLGHEGDFTLLDWNGRRIEARRAEGFAAGAEVGFVVPRAGVILHRRDRPS
ncbi:MAG: ABC transporter ATP-binding protein, partial [Alphaproteobacteria bacterium]|nr:ABC transporter ATP-binding protein [Alphaproteobacteria bacterium]